jgi:nucleotide-binding universal stress UspA family protein
MHSAGLFSGVSLLRNAMTFVPQRLLCLVDLSPMSAAVLSWARLLAESYHAKVEVFHSAWAPKIEAAEEAGETPMSFEVLGTEIEGRVNALAEAAFGTNVKFESRVIEGHPVKMVLHHIQQHPPDLIVLGSHGYDGFARVMLGSVAENVLRTAPCPILIVKGAPLPAEVHTLPTIVCAIDFDDLSRHCLLVACNLAGRLESDLHVAYVAAPEACLEEARAALSSWISDGGQPCGRVRGVVLRGEAAEMIVTYARRVQADLSIIAVEHRPFLEFTTLGRTTERVVRFCPGSVLVIPKLTRKPEFAMVESGNA